MFVERIHAVSITASDLLWTSSLVSCDSFLCKPHENCRKECQGGPHTVNLSAYPQELSFIVVLYRGDHMVRSKALRSLVVAEAVGFDPTVPFGTSVFKTAAISQTRPRFQYVI